MEPVPMTTSLSNIQTVDTSRETVNIENDVHAVLLDSKVAMFLKYVFWSPEYRFEPGYLIHAAYVVGMRSRLTPALAVSSISNGVIQVA
jgi:hypothetical protein